MAVLRAHDTGHSVVLPDHCLVGRSRACDLVLAARDVSSQHAAIQWDGNVWELQDLGSRNGTFVDEARLASGTRAPLRAGALLRFGAEAPAYTVLDVAPPTLMAVHLATGDVMLASGGYLGLPDAGAPELVVYPDPAGRWVVERGGETSPITDRAVVSLAAENLWRVHLPRGCEGTWTRDDALLQVAGLRLRFAFSRDEEHVELIAFAGDRRFDLQVRAHHYVLLVLARRRVADERAGVPAIDQGWVRQPDLLKMLKMDENHLSISVHRARAQLGKLGVVDAASLIERRPGARQLRIGAVQIELVALDEPPPA